MNGNDDANRGKRIRLEITRELASRLIRHGELHIADFRCLDVDSKKEICRIFLASAMQGASI
ncbi:MAG: hypothetical protein ACU833_05270 [Gammaproteobacteria bacterium]